MYTNEHQKCLLESYRREMESKKFELVALKAIIAQTKDSFMCNSAEESNRLNTLEREMRMVCFNWYQRLDYVQTEYCEKYRYCNVGEHSLTC